MAAALMRYECGCSSLGLSVPWCVWGAYAEASDDVHQLADVVAGEMARREWRVRGARSEAEARSY